MKTLRLSDLSIGDYFILIRTQQRFQLVSRNVIQSMGTQHICRNLETGSQLRLQHSSKVERITE